MKLRVAKNIDLARACRKGYGHRWSTIVKAHAAVNRALNRRSRLVAFTMTDANGRTLWDRTIFYVAKRRPTTTATFHVTFGDDYFFLDRPVATK